MSISERFGRILSSQAISNAIEKHLKDWLVVFLAEVERQLDITPREIHVPKSYETVSEFTKFDSNALPAVIIAVDEVNRIPERFGDASYTAVYPVGIAIVTAGRTAKETERNSMAYGAALRSAMLYPSKHLGAVGVENVKWSGETYTEIDSTDRRTKAAAMVLFDIRVRDVARDYNTPVLGTTPPSNPYQDPLGLNTADTVNIDVEKE